MDHHAALIHAMVLVSAADRNMTDAEIEIISAIVGHLPVFRDYDRSQLMPTLGAVAETLTHENGLEEAFAAIEKALPKKLRDTAYALACDVVAADGEASQEELQVLEAIRHRLRIDRLTAAAIERGTRARFARI
jgi:tellurite resistance protein